MTWNGKTARVDVISRRQAELRLQADIEKFHQLGGVRALLFIQPTVLISDGLYEQLHMNHRRRA